MKTYESLLASAEAFERHHRPITAEFIRSMAKDALELETSFGPDLYANFAREIAEQAMLLPEIPREARAAQEAAGHE